MKHINGEERNYSEAECNRCFKSFQLEIDFSLHKQWCGKLLKENVNQLVSETQFIIIQL